jgi:hypothetical protein
MPAPIRATAFYGVGRILHKQQQHGHHQSKNGGGFGHGLTNQHGFNGSRGIFRASGTGAVGIPGDVSFSDSRSNGPKPHGERSP